MGSFLGGNKGQSSSTTTSPYQGSYNSLINSATQTAGTPWQAYQGQRVADFTPDQQAAFNTVDQSQGLGQPYVNQANSYVQQGAAPVSNQSIQNAYNPFIQSQVDALQANLGHQNAQTTAASNSNAAKVGALTGDRSQVANQIATNNNNLNAATATSGLLSNAYGQAAGLAQGNQQAALTGAGISSGLGQTAQNLALQGSQAQLATGGLQQQLNQANLDVPYQNYLTQQAYPFQTQQWLSGIYGGIGPLGGSTTTNTPAQPNMLSQALGLGAAGAGAYLGAGGSAAGIGSAISSALPFLALSDQRIKENIIPIGPHPDTGHMVYQFNFKGDPTPRTGFIAQDVEQTQPQAVATDPQTGIKSVDYARASNPDQAAFDAYQAMLRQANQAWPPNIIPSNSAPSQGRADGGMVNNGLPTEGDMMADKILYGGGKYAVPHSGPSGLMPMLQSGPAAKAAAVDPDFARMTTNLGHAVQMLRGQMNGGAVNAPGHYADGGGIGGMLGGLGGALKQGAMGPSGGIGSLIGGSLKPFGLLGELKDHSWLSPMLGLGGEGQGGQPQSQSDDQSPLLQSPISAASNLSALPSLKSLFGYAAGGDVQPIGFQAPTFALPQITAASPVPQTTMSPGHLQSSAPQNNSTSNGLGGSDMMKAASEFGKYMGTPDTGENEALSLAGYGGWGATTTDALGNLLARGGTVHGYDDGGVVPQVPDYAQAARATFSVLPTDITGGATPSQGDGSAAPASPVPAPSPASLDGSDQTELNPTGGVGVAPSPIAQDAPMHLGAGDVSPNKYDENGWDRNKSWYEPGSNPDLGAAIAAGGATAMAGGSPWAGIDIGKGILAGIGQRYGQLNAERDYRLKERNAQREADALMESHRHNLEAERLQEEGIPKFSTATDAFGNTTIYNARTGLGPDGKPLFGPSGSASGTEAMTRAAESGATGDDLIDASPAPALIKAKAKAIGNYQAGPVPPGMKGQGNTIMGLVQLAYPSYNASYWPGISATEKDFRDGTASKNITSFSTAIRHAGDLYDVIDKLGNSHYSMLNAPLNVYRGQMSPDFKKARGDFEMAKKGLATELDKAFKGAGTADVTGIEDFKNSLALATDPDELKSALQRGMHMLGARIDELGNQYKRGTMKSGFNGADAWLDGPAKKALVKILGPDEASGVLGNKTEEMGQQTQAPNPETAEAKKKLLALPDGPVTLGGKKYNKQGSILTEIPE